MLKETAEGNFSERRACRVIGQHRSTQRLDPPEVSDDEARLRTFLREVLHPAPAVGMAPRPRPRGAPGATVQTFVVHLVRNTLRNTLRRSIGRRSHVRCARSTPPRRCRPPEHVSPSSPSSGAISTRQ